MGVMKDYLIFGDIDSRDYDIEMFFSDIDRTPKRIYTRLDVAGRNGAFLLDTGKYEDVQVTYGCVALNDERRKAFVNALASKVGYFRMQDSFNLEEFYLAVFDGDVDPHITSERDKSTFDISFTRKPQRWLTSGETAQAVVDGETLTNPTLFGSSPLIRCNGYGQIAFGGAPIKVEAVPIGDVLLSNGASISASKMSYSVLAEMARMTIDASKLATNDKIYVGESIFTYSLKTSNSYTVSSVSIGIETETGWTSCAVSSSTSAYFRTKIPMQTFRKGTAANRLYSYEMRVTLTDGGGTIERSTSISYELNYDGANTITFSVTKLSDESEIKYSISGTVGQINGYSTIIIDDDVIIDLDIGEAYFDDASHTSANYSVSIPAELPTLAPGANIVSFDSTFTTMEITPRWWKI